MIELNKFCAAITLATTVGLTGCDYADKDDVTSQEEKNAALQTQVDMQNTQSVEQLKELAALKQQLSQIQADNANAAEQQKELAALKKQIAELQASVSGMPSKPIDITILHMNDHHSHIAAENFDLDVSSLSLSAKTESGAAIEEVSVTYGGFPMMTTLFNTLSAQEKNSIKVHAGDAMTGTIYYSLFKGAADAAVMNEICFDIFALGNHEFDDGDVGLARFLDAFNSTGCKTPTLAANVVPHANSAIANDYIMPYSIVERDGEKIAFIGIDIAGKTMNSSQPDPETQFLDELSTAQQYIDELTEQGVNKIALVTHYQFDNDVKLAQALTGVDIIVGGDSHTLLGGENLSKLGFNVIGEYPTQVNNLDGDPVCVVQAWEYAHMMGKLNVSFDGYGVVESCMGEPIMPISNTFTYEFNDDENGTLTNDDAFAVTKMLTQYPEVAVTQPDANTEQVIAAFDEQLVSLRETVIGNVEADLCLDRWPGQGRSTICDASATYAMGSDISNIVAKAFLTVTPTADIAIQNAGGVRVDVKSGAYTIADAYTLLPFSNTLVTLEMTGQQIVSVLEDALANTLDNQGSSGSYPYAAGLRFNVDASMTMGSRISAVELNSRVEGEWAAIDVSKTYTVVTNNFIASGRDGYKTFGDVFSEGKFVDTYTEYAQGFVKYTQSLAADNKSMSKLPASEYSTQQYIGRDGCDHSGSATCTGY